LKYNVSEDTASTSKIGRYCDDFGEESQWTAILLKQSFKPKASNCKWSQIKKANQHGDWLL
tara:strand:- start:16520 stop:16702 length:183 start_codon:yes stop_codon:yes gene_type:complete